MELKFDTNRKRIKACPCCGHENKGGYVPYIGTDSGYCHYCGSSCFPKNRTIVDYDKIDFKIEPKKTDFLPEFFIEKSFTNHENIDFVKFLIGQVGEESTRDIIMKYRLSGSTKIPGAVIFWQIDKEGNIRTGKIIEYDPKKGKRNGLIQWVHSTQNDFGLSQCFFGEHLININNPVAVVESEKTACLLSKFNEAFTWIATGGVNGLTREKCDALKGFDVTLFPDHGKYDEWIEKASILDLKCSVSKDCENWFEQGKINKGEDIADYYLNYINPQIPEPVKIDPQWKSFVLDNPHLNLDL